MRCLKARLILAACVAFASVSAVAQGAQQRALAAVPQDWLVTPGEAIEFKGEAGFYETPALRPRALVPLIDILKPEPAADLFFTELDDSFIVHVNTGLGEEIIEKTRLFIPNDQEHLNKLEAVREKKREIFKEEVNVRHKDLVTLFNDKAFESKVWEDLDKRCVACGNCTAVCPTCYCFDILDNINLDLNTGDRTRRWDSCQTEPFAKVAGGENFRKTRGMRQRHRYFRKFKYPAERYSRYFCTGCGRCTRTCMAKISLKETVNALAAEQKYKK